MPGFTPVAGLAGGFFIGLAAAILLYGTGRIAGISGIFARAITFGEGFSYRWLFVAGLVVGAGLHQWLTGVEFPVRESLAWPHLAVAGILVGLGTRLGSGCTSGHGVCGLGRLSARSLIATLTFMITAGLTVFVSRHMLGWPL